MDNDWTEPRISYYPTEDERNKIRVMAQRAELGWLEEQLAELARDPETTRRVLIEESVKNEQNSRHDIALQKYFWEQAIRKQKYRLYEEEFRKRYLAMGIPGKANMYRIRKKRDLVDILAGLVAVVISLSGWVLFFYGVTQGNGYLSWIGGAMIFGVMIDWRAWGKIIFRRNRN